MPKKVIPKVAKPQKMLLKLRPMAPSAGPALVGLLVRALTDLGAEVTAPISTLTPMREKLDLTGLHVFIEPSVWVRQEEADRWL